MGTSLRALGVTLLLGLALTACGFATVDAGYSLDPPGFFHGVWHGLLAPYTLLIRFFLDVNMYAMPNSGWLYDCGFLIGVACSLPTGWLAAIVQLSLGAGAMI